MSQSVIPTPAKHKLKRAATRGLPVAFFFVLCATTALLWQFQSRSSVLVGEVEVMEYLVASPQPGIVSQLVPSEGTELDVYVSVAKDQLLVQLDDLATRQELQVIQDELIAVSSDVTDELSRLIALDSVAMREVAIQLDDDEKDEPTNQDIATGAMGIEAKIWNATQGLVEQSLRAVEITQKELDLRQLDFELAQARAANAASGSDPVGLEQFEQQRDGLADEIFDMRSSLGPNRLSDLASMEIEKLPPTARLLHRSVTNRVHGAEAQLNTTNEGIAKLDVLSPVDGQIEATMVQRMQSVAGGQPLLTVVPMRGTTVVVYARETSLLRPFAGMPVTLRSRVNPNQTVKSAVHSVGPKVEEIPQRHRVNPKQVEWGRPMRIQIPDDWIVEPGSLLDVIVEQS